VLSYEKKSTGTTFAFACWKEHTSPFSNYLYSERPLLISGFRSFQFLGLFNDAVSTTEIKIHSIIYWIQKDVEIGDRTWRTSFHTLVLY
jgi:hypothetical protein